MNKLYLIFIIILFVIVYTQQKYINTLPYTKTYEILQSNNPDKDTFEEILKEKKPAIFTNILEGLNLVQYNLTDPKFDKNSLKDEFKEHFNFYLIPFTFKYNFSIKKHKKDTYTPIIRQNNYRFLLSQVTGIKKLLLFSPEQKKYLYPIHNKNESKINFWDDAEHKNYPLFKKGKYIEFIIKHNQMVYIPYKWWYTTYNITDNMSVTCSSESIFSYFLKKN